MNWQGSYQCQVVLLSSNNLRQRPEKNKDFPNTVDEVIRLYEKLILIGSEYEKLKFVFCAIVPSYATDITSKSRFVEFNCQLKRLCAENSRWCFFFNTPSLFTENGSICSRFFEYDGIHLNLVGVELLCHKLSSFIKTLPKK